MFNFLLQLAKNILSLLALLAVSSLVVLVWAYSYALPRPLLLEQTQYYTIAKGQSLSTIARDLVKKRLYVRTHGGGMGHRSAFTR